jgi:hypothetical protein
MSVTLGRADQPRSGTRKKSVRIFAALAIVFVGVLILTLTTSRTDYIQYWCAGKLLIHRIDPYSASAVSALEKAQGYRQPRPLIVPNPPWSLFLMAPLGFSGVRVGLFLWTLATVGCVFFSVRLLNVPQRERAFAYVFAPTVASVFMGQSSAFLLLGFALFLRFNRSHPFLAGASLLLMAIKPHLFFVFWALVLADCIYRRSFLILAGGAAGLAVGTVFSMCFDPHIWQHYLTMLRASALDNEFFPTVSTLFRLLINVRAFWLLFVPSALAILWGLWYYASRRQVWDWRIQGMLVMLVSVLFSPYSWLTDEAVLLPSILFALTFPEKRKHSAWILLAINSAVLFIALVTQASLSSRAYIWTPIAWLAWFLYSTYGSRQHRETDPVPFVTHAEINNV